MVSGNEVPDFNSLSEAEQRAVAERLLRIEQSGWKPFWCPDPNCDGSPHWLVEREADGSLSHVFVSGDQEAGPNGEPVGEMHYETPGGDWIVTTGPFAESPAPEDTPVGRPVLDPKWAHNHARVDQRLPSWLKPWILFIMSGRGTGKTRTGVEFVTMSARKGLDGAIIGRRGTELVNTHVAALLEHAHPEFVPEYQASKDIILWPNGAKTFLFSAERPENIRSVNLSYFWMDEAAFMDEVKTAWMNARMATRVDKPGNPIHILITSTPTSTQWVMDMEDDPDVEIRRVSTYANRANLSPDYLAALKKEYEGTRMGRQELYGEVLRDVEGALWNDDMFRHLDVDDPAKFAEVVDSMDDRVLAVDPAGSANKRSDETGIIAVGAQHFDDAGAPLPGSNFYVLGDATIKGSPSAWAEQVFKAARLFRVSRIVAEKNYGGDMVKQVLTDYAKLHPGSTCDEDGAAFRIEVVHAQQAKETRAEGTVGKYEQGRVTHVKNPTVFGDLSQLEKEQVLWVPKSRGGRLPSPNRVDALVWAVRALEQTLRFPAKQATGRDVLSQLKGRLTPSAATPVVQPGPRGAKQTAWPTGTNKRPAPPVHSSRVRPVRGRIRRSGS